MVAQPESKQVLKIQKLSVFDIPYLFSATLALLSYFSPSNLLQGYIACAPARTFITLGYIEIPVDTIALASGHSLHDPVLTLPCL